MRKPAQAATGGRARARSPASRRSRARARSTIRRASMSRKSFCSEEGAGPAKRGWRCQPSATPIRMPRSPPPSTMSRRGSARGFAPDGGERRLAPAHPVTDHLAAPRSALVARDPTVCVSRPLMPPVGGALRQLGRDNERAPGHFLERSTEFDDALQQSAIISWVALTAPARAMAIRRQPGAA